MRPTRPALLALAALMLPAAAFAQTDGGDVVAEVGSVKVTRDELYRPLIQAHGLDLLMSLVRLDMVEQEAVARNITVSPKDVADERAKTLSKMFEKAKPEDYDEYLKQFLEQQHLSAEEFNLVLKTNAYLRKIAAPMVAGRLTDAELKIAFNARYGETVRVRHIALRNLQQVAEAQRRLAGGESFADVAKAMSINPATGPLGGEIQPFSRANTQLPELFKDTAFSLEPGGKVSDPIQVEGQYHLIKLEERIPPKLVKFEDVKQSLRQDLDEQMTFEAMKQIRNELGRRALDAMKIYDPVLRQQFQAKLAAQQTEIKGQEQIRDQLKKERDAPAPSANEGPTFK